MYEEVKNQLPGKRTHVDHYIETHFKKTTEQSNVQNQTVSNIINESDELDLEIEPYKLKTIDLKDLEPYMKSKKALYKILS